MLGSAVMEVWGESVADNLAVQCSACGCSAKIQVFPHPVCVSVCVCVWVWTCDVHHVYVDG